MPTILALDHISTLVLTNQDEINFWRTGRGIKFNFNNFIQNITFDYKDPIKVIDKNKNLLGIGFFNEEHINLNPKLVLDAK